MQIKGEVKTKRSSPPRGWVGCYLRYSKNWELTMCVWNYQSLALRLRCPKSDRVANCALGITRSHQGVKINIQ